MFRWVLNLKVAVMVGVATRLPQLRQAPRIAHADSERPQAAESPGKGESLTERGPNRPRSNA